MKNFKQILTEAKEGAVHVLTYHPKRDKLHYHTVPNSVSKSIHKQLASGKDSDMEDAYSRHGDHAAALSHAIHGDADVNNFHNGGSSFHAKSDLFDDTVHVAFGHTKENALHKLRMGVIPK